MRKFKKIAIVLLTAVMALSAAGCSNQSASVNGTADTVSDTGLKANGEYTFTDDCGREVTVKSVERTATLLGSFSDVWLSSGGELAATVDETWTTVNTELSDSVVNLGGIQSVNVELLIASQPDFVIASANTDAHVQLKDVLEAAGICVAYFYVNTFDDYLRMLKVCTDLTGHTELYRTNGLDVQDEITQIKKRVTGVAPKILFLRAASSNVKAKASDDTVGTQILKDLGCINIADSSSVLKDNLSIEAIVEADPDYIFVTTQGSNTQAAMDNVEKLLKSSPVWSSLRAVQNGNYYVLDKALYNNKPNARWGEAYLKLADILYP